MRGRVAARRVCQRSFALRQHVSLSSAHSIDQEKMQACQSNVQTGARTHTIIHARAACTRTQVLSHTHAQHTLSSTVREFARTAHMHDI